MLGIYSGQNILFCFDFGWCQSMAGFASWARKCRCCSEIGPGAGDLSYHFRGWNSWLDLVLCLLHFDRIRAGRLHGDSWLQIALIIGYIGDQSTRYRFPSTLNFEIMDHASQPALAKQRSSTSYLLSWTVLIPYKTSSRASSPASLCWASHVSADSSHHSTGDLSASPPMQVVQTHFYHRVSSEVGLPLSKQQALLHHSSGYVPFYFASNNASPRLRASLERSKL